MARPAPEDVKRIACVGGGTIRSGWAAGYLAAGKDVVLCDPAPDGEVCARSVIDRAWPHLAERGLAPGADRSRFSFIVSLADAVADVDLVQESVPEDEALKIEVFAEEVFAEIDAAAEPDTVLASSSSCLTSHLQSKCQHPGRVMIGHSFAPVYLCRLVEISPATRPTPRSRPGRPRATTASARLR